jgi:hypothetical protein
MLDIGRQRAQVLEGGCYKVDTEDERVQKPRRTGAFRGNCRAK